MFQGADQQLVAAEKKLELVWRRKIRMTFGERLTWKPRRETTRCTNT